MNLNRQHSLNTVVSEEIDKIGFFLSGRHGEWGRAVSRDGFMVLSVLQFVYTSNRANFSPSLASSMRSDLFCCVYQGRYSGPSQ